MSDYKRDFSKLNFDDEIDLSKLFNVLRVNRIFIASFTGLFFLVSIVISLFLTNIYTAQTILAPSSKGDMNNNLSQYAGLASIANITLPGSSSGILDKDLALSLIKSKALLNRLINNYDILPDLIAAQSWDLASNSVN